MRIAQRPTMHMALRDPPMEGIEVDTNDGETAVFLHLQSKLGDRVRRQRQDVGDFCVRAGGFTVIVERKTTADLASSLRDGRSKEQKARQLAAMGADEEGRTRVVWIVEGPLAKWHASLPMTQFPVAQLEAAVISANVRDCIPVLRCVDAESVAETILYLHKRCMEGEMDCIAASQKAAAATYSSLISVKKAKNVDNRTSYKMMLSTIPGCSMAKAEALAERFPTMSGLVDSIRTPGAVKMLAAVEAGSRKLGPVLAKRIVEVMGA